VAVDDRQLASIVPTCRHVTRLVRHRLPHQGLLETAHVIQAGVTTAETSGGVQTTRSHITTRFKTICA
jgi:hypothetical protein